MFLTAAVAALSVTVRADSQDETKEDPKQTEVSEATASESEAELARLQEGYRELLLNFDYGDDPVYVIGHTSPDADTVCGAIGWAYLLNELGIDAEAVIAGEVNPQTRFILKEAGAESPRILEDASGENLYLVDHSNVTQMVNGGKDARVVGIVDHHGDGDVSSSEMINSVSAPIGSTCTLIYLYYRNCGIEIPPDIAKILMSGIISDCYDKQMILDSIALEDLSDIARMTDLDAYAKDVINAKVDYTGMSDEDIYFSDYKHYQTGDLSYGIGVVDVRSSDDIPDMHERMMKVMKDAYDEAGMDILLVQTADLDHTRQYVGYYGKDEELTHQVVSSAFGSLAREEDGYYLFEPSVSRKKVIVPAIEEAYQTMAASPKE